MRFTFRRQLLSGAASIVAVIVLSAAVEAPAHVERGQASWYGPGFDGRPTASGELFDQNALTAAHPDLPLGVMATVTNLQNGRVVEVEINDRGPFIGNRVIDLSRGAAQRLGIIEAGLAPVQIEVARHELVAVAARG
jgi:rare lipoprotein A